MATESQPLLHQDHDHSHRISWLRMPGEDSYVQTGRAKTRRLLNSKIGHYFVIFLVSVDIICIFADFLISLYTCEKECCQATDEYRGYHEAQEALGIVSLVFSSLFMVELAASIWAFGFHYFTSWFRCLDATVIIVGFVIDVSLQGFLEEAGSVVVVLRLWRVFKIIEEFSTGAQEQMDTLAERIEDLEKEKRQLQRELAAARGGGQNSSAAE